MDLPKHSDFKPHRVKLTVSSNSTTTKTTQTRRSAGCNYDLSCPNGLTTTRWRQAICYAGSAPNLEVFSVLSLRPLRLCGELTCKSYKPPSTQRNAEIRRVEIRVPLCDTWFGGTRMNDIPSFEDAVASFKHFLAEQGHPSKILWVFREDVWRRSASDVVLRFPSESKNLVLARNDERREKALWRFRSFSFLC